VAYVPAGELAAKAVAENPSISARALAAQLGVSEATARRAIDATASNDAVETTTRIGLDGKERVLPKARREPPPDTPPPRIEEVQATSPFEDFLNPAEADKSLKTRAKYLWGGLFNPPPGIRACLIEAMSRASAEDIKIIVDAAEFLAALRSAVK
jgi:DNA-binding transcriptional MocR family regulator